MEKFYCLQTGVFGVNTYIVPLERTSLQGETASCPRAALVVDPAACMLTGDASKITGFLAQMNLNCEAILLTHTHFDHIMGISVVKKAFPDAKIYVHKSEAGELGCAERGEGCGIINRSILSSFEMEAVLDGVANQPEADVLLSGGEVLFDDWKVIHTPGHSPGSVCYYNEKKGLLLSGDTMFYHSWGRTDMQGGNEAQIFESLSLLKKFVKPGTIVLPGHDHFGFNIEEN
ncbi:MAG: MBL fold metallo-hydrolase [Treponema sp.]|nr:MBL fold metallo-hydrolase [Treponema sp.]